MGSRCDLPVGTFVRVTPYPISNLDRRPFVAKIVGYDLGRSKYHLGERYAGWGRWLFAEDGSWAFPDEVTEITEEEAHRLPDPAAQYSTEEENTNG